MEGREARGVRAKVGEGRGAEDWVEDWVGEGMEVGKEGEGKEGEMVEVGMEVERGVGGMEAQEEEEREIGRAHV